MRKWILPVLLMGVLLGGCVGLSAESQARIDALKADNEKSFALLQEIQAKVKTGDISIKEAVEAAQSITSAVEKNKAEIKAIAEAEGGTTRDMILVSAGVFGRTLLHGAGRVIPMLPLGPFGGVLQALLGMALQSESKKKVPSQP